MRVPANESHANDLLRRAGEIEIELAGCRAELDRAILKMRKSHAELTKPLEREQRAIEAALQTWYQVVRGSLGEKKIITLAFGSFGMRQAKPAVDFAGQATEESVIAALLEGPKNLIGKFVRVQPELNRAAIHQATHDDLDHLLDLGVRLKCDEKFFIAPDTSAPR